jgi:hypothetical protein
MMRRLANQVLGVCGTVAPKKGALAAAAAAAAAAATAAASHLSLTNQRRFCLGRSDCLLHCACMTRAGCTLSWEIKDAPLHTHGADVSSYGVVQ